MRKKIPLIDGEGNCCPVCGSMKITRHEQRNLLVEVNLATGKTFTIKDGKLKILSMREKANIFDNAGFNNGCACWTFECRDCGWISETFAE